MNILDSFINYTKVLDQLSFLYKRTVHALTNTPLCGYHNGMRIVGIDPGTRFAGYSVFVLSHAGKVQLVAAGCLRLKPTDPLAKRIHEFYRFFDKLITQYALTALALETPFLGKNAQNFLKLGYLRGILYLLSQQHTLTLQEYSPREIKRAITGSGSASKQSVARVLHMIVPECKKIPMHTIRDDVTDAIAIGLTGIWQGQKGCNKFKKRNYTTTEIKS